MAEAELIEDLGARFARFAEECSRFSRELASAGAMRASMDPDDHAQLNLRIARTVFSKWSVDIIALLYTNRFIGFQEIRKDLAGISSRVLSLKLKQMEGHGLIQRAVLQTRPPRVQYSLTEKGRRVAKLGEPVFLYLRFTEGLLRLGAPVTDGA
jgi:DNA-binding HxlR family transcriptional regulator